VSVLAGEAIGNHVGGHDAEAHRFIARPFYSPDIGGWRAPTLVARARVRLIPALPTPHRPRDGAPAALDNVTRLRPERAITGDPMASKSSVRVIECDTHGGLTMATKHVLYGRARNCRGQCFATRTEERGRQMPDIHIIPSGDSWNVKQENGDVVSAHDTQADAEKAGKDWTRANGGGEVFTHRDEGEFSRIRKGDKV